MPVFWFTCGVSGAARRACRLLVSLGYSAPRRDPLLPSAAKVGKSAVQTCGLKIRPRTAHRPMRHPSRANAATHKPPEMLNRPAPIPAAANGAKCRTPHPYISEQKRQRSEKDVSPTFRTTQYALASSERKSKNHGFLAALFPPFLPLLEEMGPPEA